MNFALKGAAVTSGDGWEHEEVSGMPDGNSTLIDVYEMPYTYRHRLVRRVAAASTLWLCLAVPAHALDEKAGEKAQLKVCEKSFCSVVLGHEKPPGDYTCALSKTWAKKSIKDNVDGKTSAWSLGDARCGASLSLPRAAIAEAMTAGKHTLQFVPHTVHCEVENGKEVTIIDVTVAPKIQFRNGKAEKAWINLKEVKGPGGWKAVLWTVAKIEDTLGLFQKDVLKAINKLISETCPSTYGPQATAAAKPTAKPAAKSPPPQSPAPPAKASAAPPAAQPAGK